MVTRPHGHRAFMGPPCLGGLRLRRLPGWDEGSSPRAPQPRVHSGLSGRAGETRLCSLHSVDRARRSQTCSLLLLFRQVMEQQHQQQRQESLERRTSATGEGLRDLLVPAPAGSPHAQVVPGSGPLCSHRLQRSHSAPVTFDERRGTRERAGGQLAQFGSPLPTSLWCWDVEGRQGQRTAQDSIAP